MKDITTIQIKKQTRKKLENFGKKGETYDELINRILDFFEKHS